MASMATNTMLSYHYQKLKKLTVQEEEEEEEEEERQEEVNVAKSSSWPRLRSSRRRRRVRVPGLRRLLRRKARAVGSALRKVLRRLKEGRPYLGELFAGNYLFMQLMPPGSGSGSSSSSSNASQCPDKYSFLPGGGQYRGVLRQRSPLSLDQ